MHLVHGCVESINDEPFLSHTFCDETYSTHILDPKTCVVATYAVKIAAQTREKILSFDRRLFHSK
jgi:hypothetical protein